MKETIRGKVYDTETATEIYALSILEERDVVLYVSPHGQPFLTDLYRGLDLLTREQAMAWIDKYVPDELVASAYEAIGVKLEEG